MDDAHQSSRNSTAFRTVVGNALYHQCRTDVGKSKSERAVFIREIRNFFGWKLCHQYGYFQYRRPNTRSIAQGIYIKLLALIRLEILHQIKRGQVTGRVIQEHIFRARITAIYRPIFRTSVPFVKRIMILRPRIGTRPRSEERRVGKEDNSTRATELSKCKI